MKRIIILIALILLLAVMGCQGDDFRISPIIEGQPALHSGYNIGPELFLERGDPAKVTGAVIWLPGIGPEKIVD